MRILATSRENLAIRGERVIRIQSLSDEDGAALFRDRAGPSEPGARLDTEMLARLSQASGRHAARHRVGGGPLWEHAAREVERRLDDRFRLLRGSQRGRMERHQTLHNTVAWSYELLNEVEQRVFDRLSAFAGWLTLEAARAVAGDGEDPFEVEDAVASLVAQSMVLASETEDGTRYRLLETLRQYRRGATHQIGRRGISRARHIAFFTAFMERAWDGLWGDEDAQWCRAVGLEFENLRVAVHAAIDDQNREALASLLKPHQWWAWHALRYEVGRLGGGRAHRAA